MSFYQNQSLSSVLNLQSSRLGLKTAPVYIPVGREFNLAPLEGSPFIRPSQLSHDPPTLTSSPSSPAFELESDSPFAREHSRLTYELEAIDEEEGRVVAAQAWRVREEVRGWVAYELKLARLVASFEALLPLLDSASRAFYTLEELHDKLTLRANSIVLGREMDEFSALLSSETRVLEYLEAGEEESAATLLYPVINSISIPPARDVVALHSLKSRLEALSTRLAHQVATKMVREVFEGANFERLSAMHALLAGQSNRFLSLLRLAVPGYLILTIPPDAALDALVPHLIQFGERLISLEKQFVLVSSLFPKEQSHMISIREQAAQCVERTVDEAVKARLQLILRLPPRDFAGLHDSIYALTHHVKEWTRRPAALLRLLPSLHISYIDAFHSHRAQTLAAILEGEDWNPVSIAPDFCELMEPFGFKPAGDAALVSASGRRYGQLPSSGLMALKLVHEYHQVSLFVPDAASEAFRRLLALLEDYNSRAYAVLGKARVVQGKALALLASTLDCLAEVAVAIKKLISLLSGTQALAIIQMTDRVVGLFQDHKKQILLRFMLQLKDVLQKSLEALLGPSPPQSPLSNFSKKLGALQRTLQDHLDEASIKATLEQVVQQLIDTSRLLLYGSETLAAIPASLRGRLGDDLIEVAPSLKALAPACNAALQETIEMFRKETKR